MQVDISNNLHYRSQRNNKLITAKAIFAIRLTDLRRKVFWVCLFRKDILDNIKKVDADDCDFQIVEAPPEQKVATAENIALLKFKTRSDMIEYMQRASAAQLNIFGPRQIARLIH